MKQSTFSAIWAEFLVGFWCRVHLMHKMQMVVVFYMMLLVLLMLQSQALARMKCPQGLMGFGDSLTDTGNYPTLYAHSPNNFPPNVYFNSIPGRSANGLTILDYLSLGFRFGLSNPSYNRSESNKADYSYGANFAVASSTAEDANISVPYYFSVQVDQFLHFVREGYFSPQLVENSLVYIFIGMNDIWQNVGNYNSTVEELMSTIVPKATDAIIRGTHRMHEVGARKFFVLGLPAMGCQFMLEGISGTGFPSDYDSHNCFKPHNKVARTYNLVLREKMARAQEELANSTFIYADLYRLHRDVLKGPIYFGFTEDGAKSPCCGGHGVGTYGHPVPLCTHSLVCSSPNSFISWDGLHFTNAFNRQASMSFLTGGYIEPIIQGGFNCSLDFSRFYSYA